MSVRMMRRESGSMSLRDLSSAAGVAIPTLRHYFGARHDVVTAIFEECLRLGRSAMDAQMSSERPFADSIAEYADALYAALVRAREVRLSDILAVSLAEGLMDPRISASTLRHIVDPTVEVLENRLRDHQARGEMRPCDPRAAALMLISPILLSALHQDQLGGAQTHPMSIPDTIDTLVQGFVRAFGVEKNAAG